MQRLIQGKNTSKDRGGEQSLLTENTTARVIWIDIMKGLLIALMVLGHCAAPFTKVIYLFHMPAFMFLSGYTAKPEQKKFFAYVLAKTKSILVPYIFWNVVFILFYNWLAKTEIYVLFPETYSVSLSDFFSNAHTADLGGATWFLLVIYTISILYQGLFVLLKTIKGTRLTPFLAMGIGLFGFWLCQTGHYLPYMFDLSLYGMLYYGLGQFFSKYHVLEEHIPEKAMALICTAVIIIFGVLYPQVMMNWPTRDFVGILENLVSAICGVYICYRISQILCGAAILTKLFQFLGKHTMTILIFHFVVFRLIFAAFVLIGVAPKECLRNLTPLNDWPFQWAEVAIGALLLCGFLAKATDNCRLTRYLFSGK